jgi:omega-6 fatty acid desaturase (delta-12 desaturase)
VGTQLQGIQNDGSAEPGSLISGARLRSTLCALNALQVLFPRGQSFTEGPKQFGSAPQFVDIFALHLFHSSPYSSCLTVTESWTLSVWVPRWYLTRHPLVANILLPPLIFTLLYRLPFDMPKSWRQERRGVHLTTLAVAAGLSGLGGLLGYDRLIAVQLPVLILAAIVGVWLFSVQHRNERTRWVRHEMWDPTSAALRSSTYLRLPAILQWFTGNIGFHHVHHLNPRVPNYRLQECHERIAALCDTPTLSLWAALRAIQFVLWDEDREKMVTFRESACRRRR